MSKYKCPECGGNTTSEELGIGGVIVPIITCVDCGGNFRKEIHMTLTKPGEKIDHKPFVWNRV